MNRSPGTIGAVVFLTLAAWGQDALTFESARFGFSVRRPDKTWVAYGGDGTHGAAHVVAVYRLGDDSRGTLPRVAVQVFPAPTDRDAEVRREMQVAALRIRAAAVRVFEGELAAHKAAAVSWEQDERGVRVAMAARWISANGFTYQFIEVRERSAPDSDEVLAKIRSTFTLVMPPGGAEGPALRRLAARCGADLVWAPDWDAAAARAQKDGRLIVAVHEYYNTITVPHTFASGALMDPDFAALLRERFVIVRIGPGDEAPFRSPKTYGMGDYSWGANVLFASADGRILCETSVDDAALLYSRAREALQKEPSRSTSSGAVNDPAALLRRGEIERAIEGLKDARTADQLRTRAAARRMANQLEEARKDLREARSSLASKDGAADTDLDADEAVVLMRMGRFEEAEVIWKKIVGSTSGAARAAEALFWLGAVERLRQGSPHGLDRWKRLVKEHPDEPWAAKAAANLLGDGALVNGTERLDRPPLAAFARASSWKPPAPSKIEIARVEQAAVAWLIAQQADDGSWGCPYEEFSYLHMGYREAITAICGSALLRFVDQKDARRAAERARGFIVASRQKAVLGDAGETLGAYGTWARTFALRFLARCVTRNCGQAGDTLSEVRALVRSLGDRQHASGGWPYVVVAGSDGGLCSSFLTAAVLSALVEARACGVTVDPKMTDRGAAFLKALIVGDGFRYAPDVPAVRGEDVSAAGRGPACALALERCGDRDLPRLAKALEVFERHKTSLASELRKDLCHTGPQGIASYFFFFDYLFAAEATRRLPAADRRAHARSIRDAVLSTRGADGTFVDMPSIGRAYGTAMALLIFEELVEVP